MMLPTSKDNKNLAKVLTFVPHIIILTVVGYKIKRRCSMSPKKGRPTSEPKDKFLKIRVSQKDLDKISYVAEKTNTSKTDVIRKGVNLQYEDLKGK